MIFHHGELQENAFLIFPEILLIIDKNNSGSSEEHHGLKTIHVISCACIDFLAPGVEAVQHNVLCRYVAYAPADELLIESAG